MFRLHETTRRQICRSGFVVCCILPTVATAGWIVHCHRPWRVRDKQAEIASVIGVEARLDDWSEPRPGAGHTSVLALIDPASMAAIAELKTVEFDRSRSAETVAIGSLAASTRQLNALAGVARNGLRRLGQRDLAMHIESLALAGATPGATFALHDVDVKIGHNARGELQGQFVAHLGAGSPADATIRGVLAPAEGADGGMQLTIDARDAAPPAWLLAAAAPVVGDLGVDATFTGVVRLEFAAHHVRGVAAGRLNRVALAAFFPPGAIHTQRGDAAVDLNELRWLDGRIESLAGVVTAEQLETSQSLVAAAVTALHCGNSTAGLLDAEHGSRPIAIDRLACRFQLDSSGLALTGALPADARLPQGCIATSDGRPLLRTPPYPRLPAGAWVQFVSGPAQSWVPATREAVDLAEQMPLPEAAGAVTR